MSKMSDLVSDAEWQRVRQSLSGKWKLSPEWCCLVLNSYLGDISTTEEKKLRIVMNYLVGTGFRTGKINYECVSSLRKKISRELKRRKEQESI